MAVELWKGLLAVGGSTLLLPSLALIACSDSATEPAGRSFPIATVVAQSYSGLHAGRNEIIRDGEAWARVWDEIHEPMSASPTLPPVDFGKEMLLLASLGTRPSGCHSVRIVAIDERDHALQAVVEETVPGANCACTGALTQPLHVVRLPLRSGPVDFVPRRNTIRCPG